MSQLKAIFVGVGGRGRQHLTAWADHPHVGVTGLVDINQQLLAEAREITGLSEKASFTALGDALRSVEAEAVVVAVHAHLHGRFIRQAMDAGKHVLVEKPFTCDVGEAESLVEAAEQRGVKLMVTQQNRYLPVERTLRRHAAEVTYGRVGFGHYYAYKARREPYPTMPHMHLWGQAVHELDTMLAVLGPVARVSGRDFQPSRGTWPSESTLSAVLEFQSGTTMAYISSSDARAFQHEFRLECEHAALVHRALRVGDQKQLIRATTERDEVLTLDGGTLNRDAPTGMIDRFADYVLEGVEPEVSGRNNLPTMRLCDAVIRAARDGGVVTLA